MVNEKGHHAIEVIGYGKNRRFCIKKVVGNTISVVGGKVYRTIEDAIASAERQGLTIKKTGSIYEIL